MYLLARLLISRTQPLVPFLGDEREKEAALVVVEIKRRAELLSGLSCRKRQSGGDGRVKGWLS